MANSIDERIVSMKFDNSQFESGVSTTLGTLDKLRSATEFKGATAGMNALGAAAETVQYKFSVMGTVIDQTIRNITNQVEAVAARMVGAITTQPVKDGFAEYETQIGAVQTILANTSSKGTTIDQVNEALDELNYYADKTIYNFTQMTRNIGTFTAAGVDLQTSVNSIQGIANLAAVSGSTSQQASTAMYQLSQAIASGTVKLMDWNSVVNAGMGGAVFQEALKRTSEHLGTGAEAAIKANGSFRESLSTGWLTVDVLTETLEQFALAVDTEEEYNAAVKKLVDEGYTAEEAKQIADMAKTAGDAATKVKTFSQLIDTLKEALGSGWTQSWETIIGDYEEAKEVWTSVSDILSNFINAMSNARNNMLEDWSDLGGRDALIRSLSNLFYGLMSVVVPLSEAFREIFPATTGQQLLDITKSFERFTEKLYLAKDSSEGFKNTFKGVFAAIDIVWQALKAIVSAILPVTDGIGGLVLTIFDFTGGIGEAVVALDEFIKENDVFGQAIQKIKNFFQPLGEMIKSVGETIKNIFKPALDSITSFDVPISDGLIGRLSERFKGLAPIIQGVGKVFQNIGTILQKVAPLFTTVLSAIGKFVSNGIEALATSIADADFSKIFDIINGGVLTLATLNMSKFFGTLTQFFSKDKKKSFNLGDFFKGLLDGTSLQKAIDTLGKIKGAVLDTFTAFQEQLKSKALKEIATAIGILTASLVVLSLINSKKLTASLAAIGVLMMELETMTAALSGLDIKGKALMSIATAMVPMAIAIGILAAAVAGLGSMDLWSLVKGLAATIVIMEALAGVMMQMSSSTPQLTKGASAMIMLGVAVRILSGAVKTLGEIDLWSLVKGLSAMGVVLLELSTFMNGTTGRLGINTGIGLIAFAAGLKIIASVINDLGNIDTEQLLKGLLGLGGALAEIAIAVSLMPATTPLIGAGLILVGGALVIIAQALKMMGSQSWEEVGKSLITLGGALALLAVGMTAMIASLPGAAAMLVAAPALIALALALKVMGSMSWEEIGKGLVTLGVALAELAVGLTGMLIALPGAAALLVAAGALAVLTPQLLLLGSMSLGQIGTALLALGGALAILVAACIPFTLLAPALLIMAGVFLAIGVASAAVGAGLALVGTGLTMIAASGAAAATAMSSMLTSLINLIPTIVQGLTQLISQILTMIITLAPQICATVVSVGVSVLAAIRTLLPQLVETVAYLIVSLLQTIASYAPQIMNAASDCIIAFIYGIANNVGKIIQAGIDLALALINGLADGIRENTDATIEAVDNLVDSIIYALDQWFQHFVDSGANLISGFIEGLGSGLGDIWDAAASVGGTALDSLCSVLDINSPSKKAETIGRLTDKGYVNGLGNNDMINAAGANAEKLASRTLEKMNATDSAYATGQANAAAYNAGVSSTIQNDIVSKTGNNSSKLKAVDDIWSRQNSNDTGTGKKGKNSYKFDSDYSYYIDKIKALASGRKSSASATAADTEATEANTAATEANTAATGSNTSSTGSNTGSTKSNTKSTEENTEALVERQKVMDKFAKNSVAAIAATNTALDSMFGTSDDATAHLGIAQEAVIALAEQIYASSLESSDSIEEVGDTTEEVSESSQDHIQAIMEAFNEQFETYRDNVKSSMDLFEQFDAQLDSTKTGDEMLSAANSQIEGYTRLAQKYMLLANRGVSRTILAELEEEGTSALPKINSMLKMSDSQLQEYLDVLEKVDVMADAIAGQMLAAQAMANMTTTWRKQAATQSGITTKMRNDYADYINQLNILSYKSAENTNLIFEETLDETHAGTVKVLDESGTVIKEQTIDIQAAIAQLATDAKEAGIEVETMMTALGDTAATEATAALQLVDAYTKAANTVFAYQETFTEMKQTVKETIESQLGLFDELELKTETTAQSVIDGLQSQINGMQQWSAEFQSLAARGLSTEILQELANLGVNGYEELHAFYTMSDDQLTKTNQLYAQKLKLEDTVATQVATSYAAAAIGGMNAYTNALSIYLGTNEEYKAAMASLSTNAQTVLQTTMSTVAQETGAQLTSALSESIYSSSTKVSTAASDTVTDAATAAQSKIKSSASTLKAEAAVTGVETTAGFGSSVNSTKGDNQSSNYISGVINGFQSRASEIYNTYYNGGVMADKGFHDGLGNGSPSWKGAQQAVWYMMGIAQGLESMQDDVEDTAYGSGSMIAEALNQAMVAAEEVDNDLTLYPTISPVVDLSDAQNGADQLAGLFNNSYGLNVNPNLGRITTPSERMGALMSAGNTAT